MKSLKSFSSVIILFFFIDNGSAPTFAQKYDAAKYFSYINKAELQIVDSNYTNAISFYDSAFTNLAVPLSQDMYNYSICTVLEKKYEAAYGAIKFLIERGCDSMIFFKNQVFSDFRILEQKRIAKDYPTFIYNRSKYIDTAITGDIGKMRDLDQYYFRKRVNNLSNMHFIDSLEKNDDSLILKLKKYFIGFQYLHEGVIGARVEDSQLSCEPIFDIIVRHHYQNKKYELTPIFKNALESGYLRPELYASWVGFQSTYGFGQEGMIRATKDSLYILKFPGFRSKVEENRKKIGLCTLEEQVKKSIFSRYFNGNGFLFFSDVELLSSNDKYYIEGVRKFTDVIPKPGKN